MSFLRRKKSSSKEEKKIVLSIEQKKSFYHVKNGNLNRLRHYIENEGISVNVRDKDTWGLLHHAANSGHVKICQYLLDRKADKNLKCGKGAFSGWTPLHVAAFKNDDKMCELLVAYGVDTSIKTSTKKKARDLGKKKVKKIIDNQKKYMQLLKKKRREKVELKKKKKEEEKINEEVEKFAEKLWNKKKNQELTREEEDKLLESLVPPQSKYKMNEDEDEGDIEKKLNPKKKNRKASSSRLKRDKMDQKKKSSSSRLRKENMDKKKYDKEKLVVEKNEVVVEKDEIDENEIIQFVDDDKDDGHSLEPIPIENGAMEIDMPENEIDFLDEEPPVMKSTSVPVKETKIVANPSKQSNPVVLKKLKGLKSVVTALKVRNRMLARENKNLKTVQKEADELIKKKEVEEKEKVKDEGTSIKLNMDDPFENKINEYLKAERVLEKLTKTMRNKSYSEENEKKCTAVLEKIEKKGNLILTNLREEFERKIQVCLLLVTEKRNVHIKQTSQMNIIMPIGSPLSVPEIDFPEENPNYKNGENKEDRVPFMFKCSLTGQIMTHPVTMVDTGDNYEKDKIEQYLMANNKDPISGKTLRTKDLCHNLELKILIEEWKKNR